MRERSSLADIFVKGQNVHILDFIGSMVSVVPIQLFNIVAKK